MTRWVALSRGGRARAVLANRLQKFDGLTLFPQNDIDGQEAAAEIGTLHLATVTLLKFKFRLYDCQCTFVSRTPEKGTDLITLASIPGHADLKMIMRYTNPSEKYRDDAVRRMDDPKGKKQKPPDMKPKAVFSDTHKI
ncbi:MAG TPA: hypothetical protein VNB22_11555 [Pyrinomonadaceae bacterium]|nr:hypothetical protein [Pyrinomonadaceae bacterium]